MHDFILVEKMPTVAEYNELSAYVGLRVYDPAYVETGLKLSSYAVCAECGGNPFKTR